MLLDYYDQAIARMLSGDTTAIPISIYVEFENVTDDSADITETTYPWESDATATGEAYFTSLASPRDYVEIPLMLPRVVGDKTLTYYGLITSCTGVHGLPCGGDGVYSKLVSMALVTGDNKVIAHRKWPTPALCTGQMTFTWTFNLDHDE